MNISRPEIEKAIANGLLPFAVEEPINLQEWADKHFYLSTESSYVEGRWETLHYQKAIMNAISNDDIREVVWIKSARTGYTKVITAAIGYFAEHKKRNQVIYQPVEDDADDYVKDELDPMIRDCPKIRAIFPHYNKRSKLNTLRKKAFRGSTLDIKGGKAGKNYRRLTKDIAFMDEADGFDEDIENEGSPDILMLKRLRGATFPKSIFGSTPKLNGRSLIERRANNANAFFKYYLPCPHCGESQHIVLDQLVCLEKKNPKTVKLYCKDNGCEIEYNEFGEMLNRGVWKDEENRIYIGNDDLFYDFDDDLVDAPERVAFHIWAVYSPWVSWVEIMAEYFEAIKNKIALKTFVNTTLGETWKEKGEKPEWKRLYDRREPYKINTIPDEKVRVITCGVDVQKNYLQLEIVGYGENKESWSIDYRVLPGDYNDKSSTGPWASLDRVLNETWIHPYGAELRIQKMVVDASAFTQDVRDWCRNYPASRVMAIKGSATARTLIGSPRDVDVVTSQGRKIRRGLKEYTVGVSIGKEELYGFLNKESPVLENNEPYPYGYCHFPEYDDEFFKQLTAEQLLTKKVKGFPVQAWEKTRDRNEGLDCRNYARIGAANYGIDRFNERRWKEIKNDLHVKRQVRNEKAEDYVVKNGVKLRKGKFLKG